MKVLTVLIVVFLIAAVTTRIVTGAWTLTFSGNLAMFVMLCLAALGHYKFAAGMEMMMPGFIPFKKEVVFWSGIVEILLGLALLFPASRHIAGILLLLLFVCLLPANINAAIKHINFEKADLSGAGPTYLWFRIPMQLFLMAWTWFFALRA